MDGMPVLDMLMLSFCAGPCALAIPGLKKARKTKRKVIVALKIIGCFSLSAPLCLRDSIEFGTAMSTKPLDA
jgi:hypothetical protein